MLKLLFLKKDMLAGSNFKVKHTTGNCHQVKRVPTTRLIHLEILMDINIACL